MAELLMPWTAVKPQQRRGMAFFLLDGLFVSLSNSFVVTFLPLYALDMGATGAQVGLLASLQSAAGIAGSALSNLAVERLNSRKATCLYFHRIIENLVLLLIVAIPFGVQGAWAVTLLFGLQMLRSLLGHVGVPAWAAFVSMVVPLQVRGRYMSVRSIIKAVSGTAALAMAGLVISGFGGFPVGYQLSFTIAATLGLIGGWFYSRIPEPPEPRPQQSQSVTVGHLAVLQNRAFRQFTITMTLWALVSALPAPFYVVYMSATLGLDARTIGLLASFSTAVQMFGLLLFGRSVDRHGAQQVLGASTLALAVVPLAWLLVQEWWHILPLYLLNGLATAAFGLAHLNSLLEITPEEGRARYTSAFYTLSGIAGALAPLIGGFTYSRSGFQGTVIVGGIGCLFAALVLVTLLHWQIRRTPHD